MIGKYCVYVCVCVRTVNSSLQNFLCGWLHFLISREQGVQVKRTGEDEFIESMSLCLF